MFLVSAIIFIVFTLFYLIFSVAIIYHLQQFTPEGSTAPKLVTAFFVVGSLCVWFMALYFLFQIPLESLY